MITLKIDSLTHDLNDKQNAKYTMYRFEDMFKLKRN